MEVVIKGTSKEIADLVVEIQNRHHLEIKSNVEIIDVMTRAFIEASFDLAKSDRNASKQY